MAEAHGSRPYHSPRREAQARATRRDIMKAARGLFVELGYVATTMLDVAAAAGVAKKTVTTSFPTKRDLLLGVWEFALAGESGQVPVSADGWYADVLAEPDPYRQLDCLAHATRVVCDRVGDVMGVLVAAAGADPEIREHCLRRAGEAALQDRRVVESLAAKGALLPGLTVGDAHDILIALDGEGLYRALVVERGWSPSRFEAWHAGVLHQQLLVPRPS